MKNKFKEIINLDEWEFEFQQRDEHPILMADFWCRALNKEFTGEIDLSVEGLDYLMTSQSKGYIRKDQKKLVIDLLQEVVGDEKYLQYIVDKTTERVEQLEEFANRKAEGVSQNNLAKAWCEFDDVFLKVIPWYYIPYYVTEHNMLSDKVEKGLLKHKGQIEKITDFNNALMTLIFPVEQVEFQKEQKDFYDLVAYAQKDEDFDNSDLFKQKANEYLSKYGWMKTFILLPIEPLGMPELIERIKEDIKVKGLEEYEIQNKKRAENTQLANTLLKVIEKDEELTKVIKWTRKYGWLLTWSVETAMRGLAVLQPFYKKVALEIGLEWSDLVYLRSDEIREGLENGELLVSKEEIKKRALGYVLASGENYDSFVVGKEGEGLASWVDEGVGDEIKETEEVRGTPASPGVVRGKVRVALQASDSHLVKEGEVLVCAMTSPDYLSAMKRSVAIVTDEGGLLCHAAIVSRELSKPCVIATKIATQVLKDGDMVEVDADKGIVRKIDN